MVVAEDPCQENSILTITQSPAAGTAFGGLDGDQITVVLTVTDEDGNSATCEAIMTLVDDEAPVILECALDQDILTSSNGNDDCTGVVPNLTGMVVAEDLCNENSVLTITQSPAAGTVFGQADGDQIIVVLTVTDEDGNSATCEAILTLIDDEAPVILVCPSDQDILTSSNGTGDCTGVIPDLTDMVLAEDPCQENSVLSTTQNPAAGTTFEGLHGDQITVVLTVTDDADNISTCEVTLTLIDDEDPVISCEDIPVEFLVNNQEDMTYTVNDDSLDPEWTDNCMAMLMHDLDGAPYEYTLEEVVLPLGETTVTWTITDKNGNTDACAVTYNVSKEPCDGNLACNDNVIVTLDENCEVLVTADMILEGSCPGLTDDLFIIRVVGDDVDESNEVEDVIVNGSGEFIIEILPRNPEDFPIEGWLGCWGHITAEDKRVPRMIGDYDEEVFKVKREIKAQVANGQISNNHKAGLIDISEYSCFIEDSPYQSCDRPYQTLTFTVDKTDLYTIELNIDGSEDGMLALFRGSFNPENPCENIIHHSNKATENNPNVFPGTDGSQDGLVRLILPLSEEDTYTALITYDDCILSNDIDPYTLTLVSDGDGLADTGFDDEETIEICRDLLCRDVEELRSLSADEIILIGAEGKGAPVFEDCTLDRVWYEDENVVEAGDCGEIYFYRHWYASDLSGNVTGPKTQKVIFRRPTLEDVYRPAKTVPIECDELSDEWLDENGNPSPIITGYPFIVSAFGIHDLKESYCNIGASYEDISEVEICGEGRKIVRQWTLLDWCYVPEQNELNNGELINYRQIIKIGDFTPPVVEEVDDIVVSTGPFSCAGNLLIPIPDVTDNCSTYEIFAGIYKLVERPIYDRYGRETGETETVIEQVYSGKAGDLAEGIELGYDYILSYRVVDECDNTTKLDVTVTVKDDVEPIAICNDDLHISIGGDGVGRVMATDVDEGSWDNCELAGLWISRKLATDELRDAYLDQIYELSFEDLVESGLDDKDNSSEAEIWVLDEDQDGEWDSDEIKEVLRYKNDMWFTWWKPELWFICTDMGEQVTIELLAEDTAWNSNVCWLDVLVEDKVSPYCEAPADVELACTELPYGFDPEDDEQLSALFGAPQGIDNCSGATAEQLSTSIDWNCNSGTIVRSFQATDTKGQKSSNTCKQVITVTAVHDYEIKFPKDAEADCSEPVVDTLTYTVNACDLLTVSVQDERFDADGEEACYKILRTYKVINWCEYDGESDPVIVSRNEDCDSRVGEEDVYVLVRSTGITYYDRDNDETTNPTTSPCGNGAKGHLTNSEIDGDITSVGYWQYTQHIKVL